MSNVTFLNPAQQARVHRLAARPPATPPDPRDTIPDRLLNRLAIPTTQRLRGSLAEDEQILLAMILPDLCGELLAYRLDAFAALGQSAFDAGFDQMLRTLAAHSPERDQGGISAAHQLLLALYLPAICHELLAHRRAGGTGGAA